jgi:hypothetical protein
MFEALAYLVFQRFFEVLDVFPGHDELSFQFFNFVRIVWLEVASVLVIIYDD